MKLFLSQLFRWAKHSEFPIKRKYTDTSSNPSEVIFQDILDLYNNGHARQASKVARGLELEFPNSARLSNIQGGIYKSLIELDKSLEYYQKAIRQSPSYVQAYSNMGNIYHETGEDILAMDCFNKAIALNPDYAEAYYNLAIIFADKKMEIEAEKNYKKAIALKPAFAEAYCNLGGLILQPVRQAEVEGFYREAIKIKPDYAEAHCGLGRSLAVLGRYHESMQSCLHATKINPNMTEAHINLAVALQALGRLEDAKDSCNRAISLADDSAAAHFNLGIAMESSDDRSAAVRCFERALEIEPGSKKYSLLKQVSRGRDLSQQNNKNITKAQLKVSSPYIAHRAVNSDLVKYLYGISSVPLADMRDNRFGNGVCTKGFDLFDSGHSLITSLKEDLIRTMKEMVHSEIFIHDSFFNIYTGTDTGNASGAEPHDHLSELDMNKDLRLSEQKYSLVYYLSVGDQTSNEPGFLQLHDPIEEILPSAGMIVIIPASRRHSVVYGGNIDRVMVGINFYQV